MPIKVDPPSHPYSSMSEDFLLRQAAAELLIIREAHANSDDTPSTLSSSLWNWLAEYGRFVSPPKLAEISSLVRNFVSGTTSDTRQFFDAASSVLASREK